MNDKQGVWHVTYVPTDLPVGWHRMWKGWSGNHARDPGRPGYVVCGLPIPGPGTPLVVQTMDVITCGDCLSRA